MFEACSLLHVVCAEIRYFLVYGHVPIYTLSHGKSYCVPQKDLCVDF